MKLYPTHIPTSLFEKVLLTVGGGLKALHDPLRADMVAAVGETTGRAALVRLRDQMLRSSTGRRILRERPIITSETFPPARLEALPESTLGGAYYHGFMQKHGYVPESRVPVHFIDDAELAYVMLRYRQVHDLWHAMTGLPPTVEGELALKAFEFAQTGLPMTALGAALGPVLLSHRERARLVSTYLPWAVMAGTRAKPLMNVYYEEVLEEDLDALRKELRVTPAPALE
ncbi:Ubiquinone biosynthesis protein [Allomyces arbusculus]|nr:Ubiquinone biosynthesis protein [Allomyces arbusculus]